MSSGRWIAAWALIAAPLYFAGGLASAWIIQTAVRQQRFDLFHLMFVVGGAMAFGLGLLQSRLLARHRARVRFWSPAAAAASLGAQLLSNLVSAQVAAALQTHPRLLAWAHGLVWACTQGLLLGAALGLAIRISGRRLPWTLWLAGLVGLELAAALALQAFTGTTGAGSLETPLLLAGVWMLHGVITSAGIAWMLDRLVFRPSWSRT